MPEVILRHSHFGELLIYSRVFTVQVIELWLRAGKGLAPGHTARKWQSLDQETGLLVLYFRYIMSPKHRIRNEFNLPWKETSQSLEEFLGIQVY